MKAINCSRYGSPDVLKLVEIKKPIPKDDEVLIRIHAASINSYDWRIMRGNPFPVRLREGLLKPKKNKILGADVAGTIEAIGEKVQGIKIGDNVYGCLSDKSGDSTYAEYVCAKEIEIVPKPKNITFEEAASIPMAAVTALQGLRDFGHIKADQKVLINGASGGVGTFAVQIAKYFGAKVTGVCSKRNMEMVHRIGADYVIDYMQEDFTRNEQQYDLILDVAANYSPVDYRRSLKPDGICTVIGFSNFYHAFKVLLSGSVKAKNGRKKITLVITNNQRRNDLLFLNQLLEAEIIVPVIDGCYPLHEASKAFWYYEKEHAKGKVIISVPNPNQ